MRTTRHPLHAGERIWPESNCYLDLWIGALHALELDPVPMLVCALAPRFEVDQWTFCKPTASEIAALYGIRVEELNVWRDVREQVTAQVRARRLVLIEVDAFYLPDTSGVSYRMAHQKTTIGIRSIDSTTGGVDYLHNAGQFLLQGEDVDGVFASRVTTAGLPSFAELADTSGACARHPSALADICGRLAAARLSIAGEDNPFREWAVHLTSQMADLAAHDLANFHAWAFATVRQAGSMAELSGHWCVWMREQASPEASHGWTVASEALSAIAGTLAAQQFRLARVPNGGSHPGFAKALAQCATYWDTASAAVRALVLARERLPLH